MPACVCFFFFQATAPTEIYTLSLHDALPISHLRPESPLVSAPSGQHELTQLQPIVATRLAATRRGARGVSPRSPDRKSTRLNSSHANISYAVFCLKKKNKQLTTQTPTRELNT